MGKQSLDMSKIFETNLSTPQMVVVFLVALYVFGGFYFVLSTKNAKKKEQKDK